MVDLSNIEVSLITGLSETTAPYEETIARMRELENIDEVSDSVIDITDQYMNTVTDYTDMVKNPKKQILAVLPTETQFCGIDQKIAEFLTTLVQSSPLLNELLQKVEELNEAVGSARDALVDEINNIIDNIRQEIQKLNEAVNSASGMIDEVTNTLAQVGNTANMCGYIDSMIEGLQHSDPIVAGFYANVKDIVENQLPPDEDVDFVELSKHIVTKGLDVDNRINGIKQVLDNVQI